MTLGLALTKIAPEGNVTLRYSHDEAARREDRNSRLLFAALGWALGAGTALLSIYVKHKFWP